MNWFSGLLNVIGIGGKALESRAELKRIKEVNLQEVLMAETKAKVALLGAQTQRVLTNDEADNRIDWEGAKQKSKTIKDDVLVYTILMPLMLAVVVPILTAFKTGNFENINDDMIKSFQALNLLPEWYKWVMGAVIVDVLAFRRIAMSLLNKADLGGFVNNIFTKRK